MTMDQVVTNTGADFVQKAIRAFGYIFIQNTYAEGVRYKLIPKDVITCTIFCARGYVESTDAETGQRIQDFYTGLMFKNSDFLCKEYDLHATESAVVYCYDETLNDGQQLNLIPVDFSQGQDITIENGAKILLCDGVLHINNVEFTGPSAISVTTGDKVATPQTRCLGLKIG